MTIYYVFFVMSVPSTSTSSGTLAPPPPACREQEDTPEAAADTDNCEFNNLYLKVSFTEKPFNSSSFRNTIAHSKLHMHAARENDLLPPLPALANERKYTEKQADLKEDFFVT